MEPTVVTDLGSMEPVEILGRQYVSFEGVDIPDEIRRLIEYPATWSNPRVLAHTTGSSLIAKILHDNPASDAMLRWVYPDMAKQHPLDVLLSGSLSGQALRDRLRACSAWLAEHFVKTDKRVVDLGGGSGSYAFEALHRVRVPAGFFWEVLDIDPEAVAICLQRAALADFSGIVTARTGNFMGSNGAGELADYAVLIGVLCGMDHATAVQCLRRIQIHLKPRAELLAATLLIQAFHEDPRTFRVLCNVGGWRLRPKTVDEVRAIFREAGWTVNEVMSERGEQPGQYAIVHASL